MTSGPQSALHTDVLLSEVELQCRLASIAAERLAVQTARFDDLEIWGALQSVLVASANVSKILWPRKAFASRGDHLRRLLGLPEKHPLANRRLRNLFEHYDELIDAWFATVQSSSYTDQIIGELPWPLKQFPQNANRHFDPYTMKMTFRGEKLDLAELLTSLADVLQRCRVVRYGSSSPPPSAQAR